MMYNHTNIYSQKERRLCRKFDGRASAELLSDQITEQLMQQNLQSIDTAKGLLESVAPEDQPAVLNSLEQKISALDKPLISRNLQLLEAQVTTTATKSGLEQLRQRFERNQQTPDHPLDSPPPAEPVPPAEKDLHFSEPLVAAPKESAQKSWGQQAKEAVTNAAEWTKNTAKATYQEVNSWSTQKKILVGAGIVGGALAARWLWKKLFGKNDATQAEQKKEGSWLSRNWTLIPGFGLLALLGYGAYRLYNGSKDVQNAVGGAINAAGNALNAGRDALAKSVERLGPAANVLWKHPHTQKVLNDWDGYANDQERNSALISAIAQDGLDFAVEGGKCVLSAGGNVVQCTGRFWGEIGRAFINHEWPDGTELFVTWIDGIPVYAITLTGLKAVTLWRMPTAGIVHESLLWPYYSVKRIGKTGWTVATVMKDGTRSNLIARRMVAGAYRQTVLQVGHLNMVERGADNVILRADMTRKQIQLLNEARAHGKLEPELMNRFEKNVNKYVEELADYLRELDPKTVETLPDHLQALHKEVMGMTGKVEYEAVKKQLFQAPTEATDAAATPRVTTENTQAAPEPQNTRVDPAQETQGPHTKPNATPEPAPVAAEARAANAAQDAAASTAAEATTTSPKAAVSAAESTAEAETAGAKAVSRVGGLRRLARPMRALSKVMGPVGVGLVSYEAARYYLYGGRAALEEQLKKESDPLKKQQIERDMQAAERGLAIDGSGTILVLFPPTAVPATAAMLTKAAVDLTGMRTSIVEGGKYVDVKREDLLGNTDGSILDTVARSSDGQLATYGQWIASESAIAGIADQQGSARQTFEAGNRNARSEAYAAYFLRQARIPTIRPENLPEAERKTPEQAQKQMQIIEQDLAAYHVQAALNYLNRVTKGSYVSVDAQTLERAQLFAVLATQVRTARRLGNTQIPPFESQPLADQEAAIDELKTVQTDAFLDHTAQQVEAGTDASLALSPLLLESLRNDLALYDVKIRQEDYSDWSLSGIGKWTSDEEGASLARYLVAKRISTLLVNLGTLPPPATPQEYQNLLERVRQELRFTPDELAKQGLQSSERSAMARAGADEGIITPEGILKLVKLGVIDRKAGQAS